MTREVLPDALSLDCSPNTALECLQVRLSKSVGLGDDWNKIATCSKALHDLDVERLEATAE